MDEVSSTVHVEFSLSVGTGRLEASLAVPGGEVTLTQMLPSLQTLSSHIIDSTLRVIRTEGFEVTCRAGCSACCHQLVPLSLFEAEALAAWVRSLPVAEQMAMEARFHAALTALDDGGVLGRLDASTWRPGASDAKEVAIDYLKQRVPCPFLQVETESCSIHPVRPFICREYLVTSPAEFCLDPNANPVVGVPVPLKLSNVMFKLGKLLAGNEGWIPLVFLFAWMRQQARPGDAIAGPGPELLHGVLKQLTA